MRSALHRMFSFGAMPVGYCALRGLAFPELGMEAIYEFTVQDMPVTVAVDSKGTSVHETGPKEWRGRIGGIAVKAG